MAERIYIQDIQNQLQFKDRRSVRRWCRNNNVRILSDIGSNKQFVLLDEFEKAKSKNYHKLPQVINSTMKFFSEYTRVIEEKTNIYKPQGKLEIEFLSILQNLNPTL